MIETVKQTTLEEMKDWEATKGESFNLVLRIQKLQSLIIIKLLFGEEISKVMLPFELPDGSMKQIPIYEMLGEMTNQTSVRTFNLLFIIVPELIGFTLTKSDRLYYRNV